MWIRRRSREGMARPKWQAPIMRMAVIKLVLIILGKDSGHIDHKIDAGSIEVKRQSIQIHWN
jgi:hypothetical protein